MYKRHSLGTKHCIQIYLSTYPKKCQESKKSSVYLSTVYGPKKLSIFKKDRRTSPRIPDRSHRLADQAASSQCVKENSLCSKRWSKNWTWKAGGQGCPPLAKGRRSHQMALRSILCSQTLGWPMVGHRPGPSEPGCGAPNSPICKSTGYPWLNWSRRKIFQYTGL